MYHESDHTVDAAKKELNAGLLELFKRCSYLYNEAFYANTKLAILRELSKASSDYENEVICAGCFFNFTQLALTETCFMNCARLFDAKSDVSIDRVGNVGVSAPTADRQTQAAPVLESGIAT